MRKGLVIIAFYFLFFLAIVLFINYKMESIINGTPNIKLGSFYTANSSDTLNYRLIETSMPTEYSFYTYLPEDDFINLSDDESFYLFAYRLCALSYDVFFNGRYIGSNGDYRLNSNIWNGFSYHEISRTDLRQSNEIVFRIYADGELGKSDFPIMIVDKSNSSRLIDFFSIQLNGLIIFSFAFNLIAFFFFAIFFISSRKKAPAEVFYFALGALLASINTLDYIPVMVIPVPLLIFKKIILSAVYMAAFFTSIAIYKKYRKKYNLWLGVSAVAAAVLLYGFSPTMYKFQVNYGITNIAVLANIVGWMTACLSVSRRGMQELIIFCSSGLLLFCAAYDTLNVIMGGFSRLSYSLFGLVFFSSGLFLIVIEYYLALQNKFLKEKEKSDFMYLSSIKDRLTGLYNYNYMIDFLSELKDSFSVVMMDIDDFKIVNDTYGHQKGDEVIELIGKISQSYDNEGVVAGRYGGDEFLYVLIGKDEKEVLQFCKKLKQTINSSKIFRYEDKKFISVSIGYYCNFASEDWKECIKKADEALYDAKKNGKNSIRKHEK
ncbi:MAG TPA: GGDEF domain-containing protein [Petrotogaceae bacterium]|nr:GGDEF domain-containing protein [Petrotogaceae bacterium]HQH33905.1 GGDEF domain-containing protein [Petrotogaceae bacterium]